MIKLSIIIPVYGVERFIDRCARSLFAQTMTDGVEYIFVNDATPDRSMDVLADALADFPQRKQQVIILTHESNRGLPAARNTGLAAAKGNYIFHCDSDDYVEPNMLEQMYNEAIRTDADMVWCDWYLTFEHNERYMPQPSYATPMDALKGMLGGRMKYNVWNKLTRRKLYTDNHIEFPAGHGMGEDMTMMMLMACAHTVSNIPKAFYHYIKLNGEAFTNSMCNDKLNDITYNVDRVTQFLINNTNNTIIPELKYFKLSIKFPWLISAESKMYDLWRETFNDADCAIWNNPYMPFHNKILQFAAVNNLNFILKAYYHLVYKLIYGVIYK